MTWHELDRQERKRARSGAPPSLLSLGKSDALIDAVFHKRAPLAEDRALVACQVHWSAIAGDMAPHSRPLEIRGGRLIVVADQSVYMQEIQFRSAQILAEIVKLGHGTVVSGLKIRAARAEDERSR